MEKLKKLLEIGLKKKKIEIKIILASKIAGPGLSWRRNGGPKLF